MKLLKGICISVLISCILLLFSFPAAAESDWSASLDVAQISDVQNGTFSVRISVEDITSETGIVCAIFHVRYDPAVLKLSSWKNAYPSDWDFSGETSFGAEDWTTILEDNNGNSYLMYSIMNTTLENGVKDDGVLYTDLAFEVISESAESSDLLITDISFVQKDLTNDCMLDDMTFTVDLITEDVSVDSSDESSAETSSEAESSDEASSIEESIVSADDSEDASSEGTEESSSPESDIQSDVTVSADTDSSDDNSGDTGDNRITMTVLLDDIQDDYGVSALQFRLSYKPSFLQFVDYEIILPENWDLATEFTEDMCVVDTNGSLMFCVMNHQFGSGVKENKKLGFRIVFDVKNVEFDPSLITMGDILVINDNLEDVSEDNYRLHITYENEDGTISTDEFSSAQNEGKTQKIVITVIVCLVLFAIAITAGVIIRKKKKA